jgi:hypothetical protein
MESRGTAGSKATARQALADRLEVISRCARVISETTPGFDDPFRMPSPGTDQALLTTGRVFVREAERVAARFVDLALPQTFVQDLGRAVDEFDEAIRAVEAAGRSKKVVPVPPQDTPASEPPLAA